MPSYFETSRCGELPGWTG